MEDNLDHKVSPDPEGILVFPAVPDRALTAAEGRMEFLVVPEERARLERCWGPRLAPRDRTEDQGPLETRASPGPLEGRDNLVATGVSAFPV